MFFCQIGKIALLAVVWGMFFSSAQNLFAQTENSTPSSAEVQADFAKTALPLLQQKCMACHGPRPQSTEKLNPTLRPKADKLIGKAQMAFPMGETFPFPDSDHPGKDLKRMDRVLRKGSMPPFNKLGPDFKKTLSRSEKMALRDWVKRARKNFK